MKRTNNATKVLIAATTLFSVVFLNSCSKENLQNKPLESNTVSNSTLAAPIALWNFDSSFTESKHNLLGVAHKNATFTSTAQAKNGSAAFLSNKNGFVSYAKAGPALPNLTTGLSADFWVYSFGKEGGAQCIFCVPEVTDQNGDPAFWPTHHVLLDGYSSSQGDTALIKVMFKANRNITYNEQWNTVGGIPNFYHRWSHVQYSYNGSTSQFTLIVNGHKYLDKVTLYTNAVDQGGVPLGNLAPDPSPHGVVVGAFQNTWQPGVFGAAQVWMLPFKGRIDALKIYNTAIF